MTHEHSVPDGKGYRVVIVGTDDCPWCKMATKSLAGNAQRGEVEILGYETERGKRLVEAANAEDAPAAFIVDEKDNVVGTCDLDIDPVTGKTKMACKFPGAATAKEIAGQ